jgi:hypothetical protein
MAGGFCHRPFSVLGWLFDSRPRAEKIPPERRSQTEGLQDFLVIAAGAGQTSR